MQISKEKLQNVLDRVREEGTKLFDEIGFDDRLITTAKLEQMQIIFPAKTYAFTEEQLRVLLQMAYAKGEANTLKHLALDD